MAGGLRPLVIWGGTGHARVLREVARNHERDVSVVVDNQVLPAPFEGVTMVRGMAGFRQWLAAQNRPARDHDYALAIGGGFGRDRLALASELDALGLRAETMIHPTASVALDATLERGCQVLMGTAIGACATIGRFAIVNTKASVDHDTFVGAGAHIGPGATLCGQIHIGDCVFVGAGATVLPRLQIGADVMIGAGAVVTKDVPPGVTVVGCPARVVERQSARS